MTDKPDLGWLKFEVSIGGLDPNQCCNLDKRVTVSDGIWSTCSLCHCGKIFQRLKRVFLNVKFQENLYNKIDLN